MMSRAVLGTALAAMLLASGSPAISRGTQAGVYTAAQAEAGSRVYPEPVTADEVAAVIASAGGSAEQ